MNKTLNFALGVVTALAIIPSTCFGGLNSTIYGFRNITANNVANAGTGQTQLTVEVIELGGNRVAFRFNNSGPFASSITDTYFDDGTLLGIASITSSSGVVYQQNAKPSDLPGGASISPAFETTAGFSADSDPPVQPNGVNPGEWLEIVFNLQSGGTYADVIHELNLGLGLAPGSDPEGTLRIGIHVQGFANGGSESFINGGVVPEPATGLIWGGMGLFGAVVLATRRRVGRRQSSSSQAA